MWRQVYYYPRLDSRDSRHAVGCYSSAGKGVKRCLVDSRGEKKALKLVAVAMQQNETYADQRI